MARRESCSPVAAWLLGAALALAGCATAPREAQVPRGEAPAAGLGLEVEAVRLSAAGYLLDVRYRVVDPELAKGVFDRNARPVLLDPATGLQLGVPSAPKLGPLRTTGARQMKAGRTYSMLFANPGRTVERGTRLALVIGEHSVAGLRVE